MKDEKSREMALFRYSVISPLLHPDGTGTLKQMIGEQANRIWTLPDGRCRKFAWGTIEEWYYAYRNGGIDALETSRRSDEGRFRRLPLAVREEIDAVLERHPKVKVTTIIRILRDKGLAGHEQPGRSTIYRYIHVKRPGISGLARKDRRAFEAPYSGSLWQVDVMYGPYLPCLGKDGKYRNQQTYLVAIIDDHSRLLCHGQFYFAQNLLSYLDCLKQAILKRGIPARIYCDNAQIFLSLQIKKIAAKLGTTVINAPIRDGSAKGKVERLYLSVRQDFMDKCRATEMPKNLEELNRRFFRWCEDYNLKEHSAINTTPLKKWMATSYKIKLLPPLKADEAFMFEDTRKVKNDGTFMLTGKLFETHSALAGKKVSICYDPFFPEKVYVSCEDQDFGRANILDRNFNASMSRKKYAGEDLHHE